MWVHEHAALVVVKRRMEDAARRAEQGRAIGLALAPPRRERGRLRMALVRIGRWIMGWRRLDRGGPVGVRQAHS